MTLLAAINWHTLFFYLFALLSCGFAIAVVCTSNVVRMAFYLTLALGSTAGLFFLAGAEFVAAMQFMIYVGGTLVLLIFGVMLTAQSRFISMRAKAGEWVATMIVAGAFSLLLMYVAWSVPSWRAVPPENAAAPSGSITTEIGLALSGLRLDGGNGYMLPFLIVSVHLLVVLIGAGYLARTKKRVPSSTGG